MIDLPYLAMFALGWRARQLRGSAGGARRSAEYAGPQQLVEKFRQAHARELDANRAMYAKDPAKLDALVANVLLPNFDTEYGGAAGVGSDLAYGDSRTAQALRRCVLSSLLRNYARPWPISRRSLRDTAVQGRPNDTTATVRTEVKPPSGDKVPVNFSLRKSRRSMEGLGRGHRRHLVRQEFPHRLSARKSSKRTG